MGENSGRHRDSHGQRDSHGRERHKRARIVGDTETATDRERNERARTNVMWGIMRGRN